MPRMFIHHMERSVPALGHELKTLYIEPTSDCNLACVMCSRNHWQNEKIGHMDMALFDKVMGELPPTVEKVFFGGVGEPTYHPQFLEMVRRIKMLGLKCEMITNGTLLDKPTIDTLLDLQIDCVWVSLDSLDEESYEDIRIGADFNSVISSLRYFVQARQALQFKRKKNSTKIADYEFNDVMDRMDYNKIATHLGVNFVMMKSNLHQLEKLITGAVPFGINRIKVSHLLPYDESMAGEICYEKLLHWGLHAEDAVGTVRVDMPLMDTVGINLSTLPEIFTRNSVRFSFMGNPLLRPSNYCRFVEEGIAFVRWDGEICPCMALLHDNTVYQQGAQRFTRFATFGSVKEQSLSEIWESDEYTEFRQRVLDFDFSPCTKCAACNLYETNEDDCFGNPFPTCGPCLWAQGLIQCP